MTAPHSITGATSATGAASTSGAGSTTSRTSATSVGSTTAATPDTFASNPASATTATDITTTATNSRPTATGPLAGMRVLEVGGIGPGPYAGMLLADMGADIVRIERPDVPAIEAGPTVRGRTVLELDLKQAPAQQSLRELAAQADVLIEGFRPGVMERLGLGPDVLLALNPALIYGRMTGWGQTGPLAKTAGHDINYIAITGALEAIGPPDGPPSVPLNLIGDYGGGAMFLVVGILAAYAEAQRSGQGQVVDAAICDGVVSLMTLFHRLKADGMWPGARGENLLDGGAPYYRTYVCKDGKYLAVGAIEPQFYAELRRIAGWSDTDFAQRDDPAAWPSLRAKAQALMLTRTQAEWLTLFEGSDACVAPVLTLEESKHHPHLRARDCFVELDGLEQPAPAPRFSRTPSQARPATTAPDAASVLQAWQRAKT